MHQKNSKERFEGSLVGALVFHLDKEKCFDKEGEDCVTPPVYQNNFLYPDGKQVPQSNSPRISPMNSFDAPNSVTDHRDAGLISGRSSKSTNMEHLSHAFNSYGSGRYDYHQQGLSDQQTEQQGNESYPTSAYGNYGGSGNYGAMM